MVIPVEVGIYIRLEQGKTPFPEGWSGENMMREISDIVAVPFIKRGKRLEFIKGCNDMRLCGLLGMLLFKRYMGYVRCLTWTC